ncbi:GM10361 [Drosophila sechellia]|uniref:GM10361 n=2 Tax=Drosophila sechellia TaxID=7238 RepID=B4IC30_DROSE|nr:GM10361 [Drosophila sechellia]
MVKMMLTVVVVFTSCWLPFNILQLLLNDEEFVHWDALPYLWFAFHWLAMSHCCYNPIIYCYMNARFRSGFVQLMHRMPGLRRCCCLNRFLRSGADRMNATSGTGPALPLNRMNTSTTYISARRKPRVRSLRANPLSCVETSPLR